MNNPLNVEGQKYKDFLLIKHLPLEELQSTLVELIHEPTGARVLHIASDDQENLFCLSFQTLPDSSNGVAHILEHTVLCGSKKYPIKDPFFSMGRRSLNTFMNAFTGQDFTCYPASSQIEQDFYNLLEVYIDAVFHPELKKLSFLQEGHRLEFSEQENPESPLTIQGIVYNEMKGSLAQPDSRLWRTLFKYLYPDLPYANNTGGEPSEIPNLSYEELISFHENFYHPSRCLFFFYGNIPLAKHLDFISNHALKGVKKLAPLPPLPPQKRFSAPKSVVDTYPIAPAEMKENQAIISFGFLTCNISSQEELLALAVLDHLLMGHDASPLKKAFLKSGLMTSASSGLDAQLSEVPYVFVFKGCHENAKDDIQKLLNETLISIQKTGFSEEEIEASLHQFEFDRSEIGGDDNPFGLTLYFRSGLLVHHGINPEQGLLIHTLFKDLRQKCKKKDYFDHLIQTYFLDNKHLVILTLKPDPLIDEKEHEEEAKRLKKIRENLTPSDIATLIETTKELAKYQEQTEEQSLECLPKIALSSIPLQKEDISLSHEKKENLSLYHHECFTNSIFYADLLFALPEIKVEDLPLLSLFSRLLPELGAGLRSYEENLLQMHAYTGGIGASISLHISQENPNVCRPTFGLKGKSLERNSEKLLMLMSDLFKSPDLRDKERIKELVSQHVTSLQHRLSKNGLNYATQLSLASFSVPSFLFEKWHGLSYYQSVLSLAKDIDGLILHLNRLKSELLNPLSFDLVVSSEKKIWDKLHRDKSFDHFMENLPKSASFLPWTGKYNLPTVSSHARPIASPVASTSWGMNTISYNDPSSPYLLLATELLQNVWLHNEIREKGGAYGAGAGYAPTTGNFYLYSYRDPALHKTYKSFQKALENLASGKFNEEHLEEAKLCVLQTLDAPIIPASRAITAYAWQKAGRSIQDRNLFREKIITASKKEIIAAILKHLLPKEKILISFLGEALYQKDQDKIPFSFPFIPISEVL